jgi:hypothetical protein
LPWGVVAGLSITGTFFFFLFSMLKVRALQPCHDCCP